MPALCCANDVRFTKTKSFYPPLNLVPINADPGEQNGVPTIEVFLQ